MNIGANSYNVLIQVQSQNESERIISLFRAGGIATRAHRVTSEQDFTESLTSDNWDLLIVDNRHPEIGLQFSLDHLKKQQADVPVVLLTDDTSTDFVSQAFELGLQDVIDKADDKHFIHAARREMSNSQQRRQLQELQAEFNELNNRAEQLLSESNDAIAYVSDGIIMQCNESFVEAFGYADADDLDCASIIDMVAEEDHDRFKNFFKHYSKGDMEQTELPFKGLQQDDNTFEAFMSLSNSTLDGEPCTQITISTAASSGNNTGGAGPIDTATELYNRYYLADQMTSTAMQVTNGVLNASLMVYELDEYSKLLSQYHISGIDALIKDLATHLQGELGSGELIARLGSNSVGVIIQKSPDDALAIAQNTLKTIENHICEFGDRTVQYTCSCSIIHLNNKDAVDLLDQTVIGLEDIRLNSEKNAAAIHVPAVKEAPKLSADDISSIDEAIEAHQFRLLFQPIMSLQGDTKENYETTVLMMDTDREYYPDDLIKAAADTKLDRWLILEATKALAVHQAHGHKTRLIINLTVNAVSDDTLAPWVGVAIKAANLTADDLIFQFSEQDVRDNLKAAIQTLGQFQQAGFKVSVNHFGKDDDPFKLIKHLKLDVARLDGRFTEMLTGDTTELKDLLIEAKEHNIQTILPEVDNASALATLWQLGTDYIQGSYLQSPSPVMNFEFAEIA